MVATTELVQTLCAKLRFIGVLAYYILSSILVVGTGVPDCPFVMQTKSFYSQYSRHFIFFQAANEIGCQALIIINTRKFLPLKNIAAKV